MDSEPEASAKEPVVFAYVSGRILEKLTMKGPRSRHRHNVHRIWECPACQKRVFEPARVTHRICVCQGKERPTQMRLIEVPPPWRRKAAEAPEAIDRPPPMPSPS